MRAMNNSMRTMEHMRRWGIAERDPRAARACRPSSAATWSSAPPCTATSSACSARTASAPTTRASSPAEPGVPMSQKYTARVLRARAQELGCARAHRLASSPSSTQSPRVTRALGAGRGARAAHDDPRALPRRRRRRAQRGARAPPASRWRAPAALGKHVHAVIGCPGLLEDLSVSAGLLLRPVQPARRRPRAALRRRRVQPPSRRLRARRRGHGVEELAAKARIVIGRDVEVEVRRVLALPDPRADRRELPPAAAC